MVAFLNVDPQIKDLWKQTLSLLNQQAPHDTRLLEVVEDLLLAGLDNRQKPVVNATITFWNGSFGRQTEIQYPQKLAKVLLSLKPVAAISLPGWQENKIEGQNEEGKQQRQVTPPEFSQELSASSQEQVLLGRKSMGRLLILKS